MLTLSFSMATWLILRSWENLDDWQEPRRRANGKEGKRRARPPHVVLLGDSTLDNVNWVGEHPSVTEHLKLKIKQRGSQHKAWRVTNCSIDGYMIQGVVRIQIPNIPRDASHLIVSVGGNNALGMLGDIDANGAWNPLTILRAICKIYGDFQNSYEAMLDRMPLPNVTVCTLYLPQFIHLPLTRPFIVLPNGYPLATRINAMSTKANSMLTTSILSLGVFCINRVIRGIARRRRLPVIDLYTIFDQAEDYANPIEPSAQGGDKISENILSVVLTHDFDGPSRVYNLRRISEKRPYPNIKRPRGGGKKEGEKEVKRSNSSAGVIKSRAKDRRAQADNDRYRGKAK